jgi:DNA mismatch repair protein PMS2
VFIIDQHAADEKTNYEKLCVSTVIHSQRLISPMLLNLSPLDKLTIADNLQVFKKNGFEVEMGEDAKLVTMPYSKNTTFDLNDFHELIGVV